jgi:outer membrane biosynthesis protein TonB
MQAQFHWRFVTVALALTLFFVAGCKKQKPPVPPPQAQAPTVSTPQPEQQTEQPPVTIPPTEPSTSTTTPPEQTTPPEKPSPSKPRHTIGRRHPTNSTSAKKPAAPAPSTPPASTPPATTTAKATPDADVGQIAPPISPSAASQAQQSTTQLLDATEQNLHGLTRTLSNDEQVTVSQIRSYIVQARSALKDQELERAHTLALKAHQLSDVLLRQ